MKTKVILLAAATSLILFSCSDRNEDEAVNPMSSKAEVSRLKTSKDINGSMNKTGDSPAVIPQNIESGAGLNLGEKGVQDPIGSGETIDPTKPDRPR